MTPGSWNPVALAALAALALVGAALWWKPAADAAVYNAARRAGPSAQLPPLPNPPGGLDRRPLDPEITPPPMPEPEGGAPPPPGAP